MKKIQMTLIQIDNYGPWTVTPEPRRESELQALQAGLFAELERSFASCGGLVFQTRVDNMLAITNGIDLDEHHRIQKAIDKKFPVSVSMGIGAAATPYYAQTAATLALQRAGSSRSAKRKAALVGSCVGGWEEDWVQIAHIDVNHSTSLTDSEPIYNTHVLIQKIYTSLMSALVKRKALVFYTGGDNFMAPSNGLDAKDISAVFSEVKKELGVELKAGVGGASNAEIAAHLASEGLHEIRKHKAKGPVVFKSR